MEKQGFRAIILVAAAIASTILCRTGSAAVQLQLKLDKGKTYHERTVVDQKITQTVMGQEQVINLSLGTGMKLDVLDVDAQGNMRIRYTCTWSMFKQTGGMAGIDYDSGRQPTAPAGAEPLAALLGQSYVVRLDPKGEVLDVNGVEEMRDAVHKKLPPGAESGPAMNVVNPYLDKQKLKEIIESAMAVYPDKPVEQGESWSEKKALTLGFGMLTESKWTLQKREAGVATIATASSVRSNPDAPPMDSQGMKVKFDVSGTQEGTIRMAEATGLITTNQNRQLLKGEIQVGTGAEGPPMMAIPVGFETNSKFEMSDKMWGPAPQ